MIGARERCGALTPRYAHTLHPSPDIYEDDMARNRNANDRKQHLVSRAEARRRGSSHT
jgi:hypothetical protein